MKEPKYDPDIPLCVYPEGYDRDWLLKRTIEIAKSQIEALGADSTFDVLDNQSLTNVEPDTTKTQVAQKGGFSNGGAG